MARGSGTLAGEANGEEGGGPRGLMMGRVRLVEEEAECGANPSIRVCGTDKVELELILALELQGSACSIEAPGCSELGVTVFTEITVFTVLSSVSGDKSRSTSTSGSL